MYHLLLMLSWLAHGISAVPAPPTPERLIVKWENLRHVLHWERGAGTAPEVTYSVSFFTDSSWPAPVPGCEQILEPLQCDLSDVCSEEDETYHLTVNALHRSEQSSASIEFLPIRDTDLQLPVFQVVLCGTSLCVDMDTPVPHLRDLYESFYYELKVENSATQQAKLELFKSLKRRIIGVKAGSESCVSIRFADPILLRESNFSQAQCVFVPSPMRTATVPPLTLTPGLLVLFVLLLLPVFYVFYMCRKKPGLPSVLTSIIHTEEMFGVSCHPATSSLLLISPAPPEGQTEYCSSERDSSEDECDSGQTKESTDTGQYRSKASLCSLRPLSASQGTSKALEVQMEGPEEVDLLTLTFSRDNETDNSAVNLPETERTICDVMEEEEEPEEEFGDESFHSGYMCRR